MPDFDLATGVVKFKGDFNKFEEDLKAAQQKTADLNASMASGKFGMAAYEAKRINKELMEANKNAKRMMDTINLGKFGVLVRDFNAGLNKFAANASKFGAIGTGVGGAALAAGAGGSPLAKSTLQGSFDLLMTEFGGTFTPLVKDVSKGLQDLRKTFRDLSPEVKGLINDGAKFIGVAGLAALGLAAVAKGMSLLAANPLIALMAAGSALIVNEEMKNQGKLADVMGAKRLISGTTAEDAAKGWQGNRLSKMNPLDAKAEAERLFKEKWVANNAAIDEYEATRSGMSGFMSQGTDREQKAATKATIAGREFAESRLNLEKFGGVKLPRKEGEAAKKDDMLLGSVGPSSMTDVAGLFKSFQMAGAGGNQLESENKRIEKENDQKFISDKVTELVNAIKNNAPVQR